MKRRRLPAVSRRFTEGKGVLQAIAVARRVGIRLVLAAAEDDYYRWKNRTARRRVHVVYHGEADFSDEGETVWRCAALLYPIQAAASRSGWCSRKPWRAARPSPALDRGAVREIVDDGVTGVVFSDLDQMAAASPAWRPRSDGACAGAPSNVSGPSGWWNEYVACSRRIVEAHRGRSTD